MLYIYGTFLASIVMSASIFSFNAAAQIVTPSPTATPPKTATRPGPSRRSNRLPPTKQDLSQDWKPPIVARVPPTPDEIEHSRASELIEEARKFLTQNKPDLAIPLLLDADKLAPKTFAIKYVLGLALAMSGQMKASLDELQNAVALSPKRADARATLCDVMARAGRRSEALDECREAVRLAPSSPRYSTQLAELFLLNNRAWDVIQLLERLYTASQRDIALLGTLADAYFIEGEYSRALTLYEAIAKEWPNVSIVYLRLSLVYDYLDQPQDSIDAARKFVALEPNLALAHTNLGEKLKDTGFFDESLEAFLKAVSLDQSCGSAYLSLSEIYEILGDKESMLANLRSAYRYLPRDLPLVYRYGNALYSAGRAAEAIEPLELANSMRPNTPDILRTLGFAYMDVYRFDEGVEMVEQSMRLSPLPPGFTIDLSRVKNRHELLARFDELVQQVKKEPDNFKAHYELSEAYLFKGMPKEAEQQYLEMLRLAPNDYRNYNGLHIFYSGRGEYEKALTAIRRAVDLNPHHVLYMSLSGILLKLGRLDEAIVAAKRSIEIKSTLLESRLSLGDLWLKKGNRAEALREFQAGFELASGDVRPNFRLAWLYIRMGNKEGAFRHYGILRGIAPGQLQYLEKCLSAHFGPLP